MSPLNVGFNSIIDLAEVLKSLEYEELGPTL